MCIRASLLAVVVLAKWDVAVAAGDLSTYTCRASAFTGQRVGTRFCFLPYAMMWR